MTIFGIADVCYVALLAIFCPRAIYTRRWGTADRWLRRLTGRWSGSAPSGLRRFFLAYANPVVVAILLITSTALNPAGAYRCGWQ